MSPMHRRICIGLATAAVVAFAWPIAIFAFNAFRLTPAALHANALALMFLWALGPALWFAAEKQIWGDEPGLERRQQYARDLWLGSGAIVLTLAAQQISQSAASASAGRLAVSWSLVADLIKAAIWPLVTMLGLVLLRKPVSAFLSGLGTRASKIGAFNFSIELASLPEAQPWSGPALEDLRSAFPTAAADSSGSLFQAIADTTQADYVTVNLRLGKAWLTSRLFILAALIPRVRPIQRIVFLVDPAERFLGECAPAVVASELALAYPWLEQAYITGHGATLDSSGQLHLKQTLLKSIMPNEGSRVMSQFLSAVKQGGVAGTPGWTYLGNYVEHAEWVSDQTLVQLLGSHLNRGSVKRDPSEDGTAAARTLLRHDSDYVAVVDMADRFLRLIDRHQAADQALRRDLTDVQ